VHHRLEVVVATLEGLWVVDVQGDDVGRFDLVEPDPFSLDPNDPRTRMAGADMAEGEVEIAFDGDDPTGRGHPFAERIVVHEATPGGPASRRSVGG